MRYHEIVAEDSPNRTPSSSKGPFSSSRAIKPVEPIKPVPPITPAVARRRSEQQQKVARRAREIEAAAAGRIAKLRTDL